jgi:(p)ppGpp synthase/HD superfamily hydrolase
MHSYAQTNLQLFNQLSESGYAKKELSLIYDAYQLVMELFTGGFRSSGKPFIAHLVGTASILTSLGAPGKVVAAGLLHATYTNGDFGDGKKGINNARREKIRLAVGEEVEEYIARYTALPWNEKSISAICDRFDTLNTIERDVLLIRLTNELEEYLDFGILYCGELKYQRYVNHSSDPMVEMAEKLGFPTLAKQLITALQETSLAEIPSELRNQSGQNVSFVIAPHSYRKKLSLVFYPWLFGKLRRLRSVIRHKIDRFSSFVNLSKKSDLSSQLK